MSGAAGAGGGRTAVWGAGLGRFDVFPAQRHDLRRAFDTSGTVLYLPAIACPLLRQQPALLQPVAPSVCRLYLVANRVRQRQFGKLPWEIRTVGCPIAERRTEAVDRHVLAAHAA